MKNRNMKKCVKVSAQMACCKMSSKRRIRQRKTKVKFTTTFTL